ncbi:hypothetical protein P389DRAFT_169123 [Cystobasidium minutum MCA 4210]|uniref:uncharacterized protein n=1 Tax=Cystobasidium minutum MCA 4210 TaxID=1397322 RepID=UPI0034CE5D90|eukprot:jgi/Rhomi1/169123/fgenesh1_kg.3_\
MDKPEILEIILKQLPLRSQLACTLVSRQWYNTAHALIWRYHLASFTHQLETLRCFTLNRATTSPTSSYFHSLHLLSNLVSLTIAPDARIASDGINRRTGQYDSAQLCLDALLPELDNLKHLYIHGQDLRCRPIGGSASTQLGGTDNALIAFANSRREKRLSGLQTLSIISSPDLTDDGLAMYLETRLVDEGDSGTRLGSSLTSLTLVKCPGVGVKSLHALASNCASLRQLTLRYVDGLFQVSLHQDSADTAPVEDHLSPSELFHILISKNKSLHSFTFSTGLSELPADFFKAFNDPSSSLQDLHIHSSKALRAYHLRSFTSIYKLSITGCGTALGDDLPFETMPRLQEFSFLGRGLSLFSMWKLLKLTNIRKITLDVAGSAYETCICSEGGPSSASDGAHCHNLSSDGAGAEAASRMLFEPFPPPLEAFKNHNVLASSLPSWVVAYFLSHAPQSLDSISLLGSIMPTCCSVRQEPILPLPISPSHTDRLTAYGAYVPLFYYQSLLPAIRRGGLILEPVLNYIPVQTILGKAVTALYGYSSTKTSSMITEEKAMPDDAVSDSSFGNTASDVADTSRQDSEGDSRINSRRRTRSQSISGIPTKKAALTRRSLQRSKSAFVDATSMKLGSKATHFAVSEGGTALLSNLAAPPLANTLERAPKEDTRMPNTILGSSYEAQRVKDAALTELLAISTTLNVSSGSKVSADGGVSRLNEQQIEWLHTVTQGHLVRLEL